MAQQVKFYLIVSPDPRDYRPVEDAQGRHHYFIKFGDGEILLPSNTRYSTHNPSYDLRVNNKAAGGAVYARPFTTESGVEIGRFLGRELFGPHGLNLAQVDPTVEWYKIYSAPNEPNTLQGYLNDMLGNFHDNNFDGIGILNSDQVATAWINDRRQNMANFGFH